MPRWTCSFHPAVQCVAEWVVCSAKSAFQTSCQWVALFVKCVVNRSLLLICAHGALYSLVLSRPSEVDLPIQERFDLPFTP